MTAFDAAPPFALRRPQAEAAVTVAVGLLAAVGMVIAPQIALAGGCAVALMVAVFLHPPAAAYVLIGIGPLITGIDRGAVVPLLRPHEALLLLVSAPLVLRGVIRLASGRVRIRFTPLDASLVLMAAASSVVPLVWMVLRRRDISTDDLLYALTLWKFLGLYLVVRSTIRSLSELRKALWLSLTAGAIVGVVAILQSLELFGVPGLLATWYAPFGDETALEINRGTSLVASSFAVADVMTFNLVISVAMLLKGLGPRLPLLGLSGLFVLSCLASGQFSGVIALLVGLVVVGLVGRALTRGVLLAAPALALAGVVMQPVLERRLSGFQTSRGLPSSWLARLENLERFFWPELFRDYNWVFGVRPSARVPAPAVEWWRDWVWIESGHTWLLWNGGIPLFVAFFFFLLTGARHALRSCRRPDEVGVVATALLAALAVIAILTTFDPHLIMRGSGDMLFALLGLSFVGHGASRQESRSTPDGDGSGEEGEGPGSADAAAGAGSSGALAGGAASGRAGALRGRMRPSSTPSGFGP